MVRIMMMFPCHMKCVGNASHVYLQKGKHFVILVLSKSWTLLWISHYSKLKVVKTNIPHYILTSEIHLMTFWFYDFACNLQEYCLNLESGFYSNVRFFHGFTHKCKVYNSTRLLGFEEINSEICEQFNSFIQCIKASASQMSQTHFVFYLKFFILIWNEREKNSYNKRLVVALGGTD